MHTLFNGDLPAFAPPPRGEAPAPYWAPGLLIEWPSPVRVFFSNLVELFRRPRRVPVTSAPAPFWPDVFVPRRRLRFSAAAQSLLWHALLVGVLASSPTLEIFFPRVFQPIEPRSPFQNSKIVYYPVSEYLPPINDEAESAPAEVEQKGDPVYAPQRIVSRPRNADNATQTIITPSLLPLTQDVPLPNIVALSPTPAPPLSAATSTAMANAPLPSAVPPPPEVERSRLVAPALQAAVAPPPRVDQARGQVAQIAVAAAVAPPPTAADAGIRRQTLGAAAPVGPAPAVPSTRRLADMNASGMNAQAIAPPPDAQALGRLRAGTAANTSARDTANTAVPPPVASAATHGMAAGPIIALGIHPAAPAGPIEVPQGTRRGTFAAGPEGKFEARGTPEIRGGGTREAKGGNGNHHDADSPTAGITVARGPVDPGPAAVAGNAPPASIAPPKPASGPNAFRAALGASRAADIARATRRDATPMAEPKAEDKVFGSKKYYSMTLNMPNLAAPTGSWIIRFAELHESRIRGDLTAPVVTQKVDPGYPSELMRQGVHGVVVLYAIIRADGTVGEVRVLRGIDRLLDGNARAALLKWHFLPGTKNGAAVDLEAVVQIPFAGASSE